MENNKVQIFIVRFKNEIAQWEVPLFRGGVNEVMEQKNVLFHNHMESDKVTYRYPLIQYKRINNKASMVCLQQGTEAIGDFFTNGKFDVIIGERNVTLDVDHIEAGTPVVQVWDEMFTYRLRKWLPLSSENYATYKKLDGLVEQMSFLEKILVGNILSFAKGVDVTIDKEISCKIVKLIGTHSYTYKGVKMMGFDVEFRANVSLPDYIGIGKGASRGYGIVHQEKKRERGNEG